MNDFENKNLNDEISDSDFTLVQENVKITDKKLDSKPTTFLKDAFKRFCKNKSSVVAFFILAILILLAIFVPVLSSHNIDTVSTNEQFLAPKLFKAGTGFWDGTRKYTHVVYDTVNEVPAGYYKPAVIKCTVDENYTLIDQASSYATGGVIVLATTTKSNAQITMDSYATTFTKEGNYKVTITFDDEENYNEGKLANYSIYFVYKQNGEEQKLLLQEESKSFDTVTLDISAALANAGVDEVEGSLRFVVNGSEDCLTYILLKSVEFSASEEVSNYETLINSISFTDATKMVLLAKDSVGTIPVGYWSCTGRKGIHNSRIYYCNFTFDTYANVYDNYTYTYSVTQLDNFVALGYCTYTVSDEEITSFEVLSDSCPIVSIESAEFNHITKKLKNVVTISTRYKVYGYSSMPKYLMGTDVSGHDVFKKAFAGLRTSLILGVCTAAFCFAFGLCWGAISGYFGGTVDILMERFCDILSGVPWIVIMTLCILKLGNSFFTFFLALCLTGWMGTAARTRTQFYRFKGREYVLASRTLGSSDWRLIFRHILPNSLGTIITSSVLMIPSVIFSEATLAYLNLGLQGKHSFGVMMSDNQQYLQLYPNLVLFPAVILALMMISFNLFGNGLRDAVNPSLKGSE